MDQNTPLTPMVGLKSNLNLEQQQHQQTDGQRTRTITPSSISVADRHSGSSSSGTRGKLYLPIYHTNNYETKF